jgi:hypothetical protein
MTLDHSEANDGNTRAAYKAKVLQFYDDLLSNVRQSLDRPI